MALMRARKDLTVYGRVYRAGEPVPMDSLPATTRRQIIEQKRVVPDRVVTGRSDDAPRARKGG